MDKLVRFAQRRELLLQRRHRLLGSLLRRAGQFVSLLEPLQMVQAAGQCILDDLLVRRAQLLLGLPQRSGPHQAGRLNQHVRLLPRFHQLQPVLPQGVVEFVELIVEGQRLAAQRIDVVGVAERQ